jgi:putative DNA primase/helicase
MMQPVVLMRLLSASDGASRGMGLIARCLIAWPTSTIGSRLYKPAPEGLPALARFHRRLRELLEMRLPADSDNMALSPTLLRLSPAAFAVWRALHDEIEVELAPSREFGTIPDVGAKIAENAARLAGIFHLIENGPVGEIEEPTMDAATRVAVWHLAEARRTVGTTEKPQTVADAELLLEWLQRQPLGTIEPRRILNRGPAPLRDKKRRDGAIELLAETSHIFFGDARRSGFVINPKARGTTK